MPFDIDKQLKILKDCYYDMGMIVDTKKIKVMLIKSNKNSEEVTSYKYLGIDIHHKLN